MQQRGALGAAAVQRITFTSISEAAVRAALAAPRAISAELVDAYLTRVRMDYLLGFSLSPVLWRKLPGAKSAGRVQSPALQLLAERERARDLFTVSQYYSIAAQLASGQHKARCRNVKPRVCREAVCCYVVSLTRVQLPAALQVQSGS
jgi:DNA topoisomerase I